MAAMAIQFKKAKKELSSMKKKKIHITQKLLKAQARNKRQIKAYSFLFKMSHR
jgi:hypothetical protein